MLLLHVLEQHDEILQGLFIHVIAVTFLPGAAEQFLGG